MVDVFATNRVAKSIEFLNECARFGQICSKMSISYICFPYKIMTLLLGIYTYSAFYNSGHEFPPCFSARDVNFLRAEIEEVFKSGKHAVEEINKTNPQAAFAFTLFHCINSKSEPELSYEMDRCHVFSFI